MSAPDDSKNTERLRKAAALIGSLERQLEQKDQAARAPVAIIGIGCRLPGAISGPEALWQVFADGGDVVGPIPAHRWDIDKFHDERPLAPGKIIIRDGAVLDDVKGFDAAHFGISPREAAAMDPQQRIMLEVAKETFEDAGLTDDNIGGTRTGVFVGVTESEYAWQDYTHLPAVDSYTGTGAYGGIVANRISYAFDLKGPSFTVDSICSSSLLAVHQAVEAIRRGECSQALAGGVCILVGPDQMIWLSKLGVLSPGGKCRAFDADGDGIVLGEGCAAVMLKPLTNAVEDGDNIYAVIRGNAANQDGRSNGMTAPSRLGQEAMLRLAYEKAGVDPKQVSYVDGHGTGTKLGDPIEANALGAVLGTGRAKDRPFGLGSAKTNLGHLGPVGGVVSLIKTSLALKKGKIPASLHFEKPNSEIDFDALKLYVPTESQDWPDWGENPPLAGVTSLAFGGTNVHVVLEGAPAHQSDGEEKDDQALPVIPVAISAGSPDRLREQARAWLEFPENGPLDRAAYTTLFHRDHGTARAVLTAANWAELKSLLSALSDGKVTSDLVTGSVMDEPLRPVFICSGHGSQYAGMARELIQTSAVFREAMEDFDKALKPYTGWSLMAELEASDGEAFLGDTEKIQPAICAVQIALARLWQSFGVMPVAVAGISMGEVAAAHISGALDLDGAARVIARRTQLLAKDLLGKGAMALAELSYDDAVDLIKPYDGELSVAVSQSPRSTVLSGAPEAMDQALAKLEADGIFCRKINVDFASHSHFVDEVRDDLVNALKELDPKACDIPFFSTVHGREMPGTNLGAGYWADNLRQPVLFSQSIDGLAKQDGPGANVFIELSPHPLVTHSISECFEAQDERPKILSSLNRDVQDWRAMTGQLGQLFTFGHGIDWRPFFNANHPPVSLAAKTWDHQSYWLDTAAGVRGDVTGDHMAGPSGEIPGLIGSLVAVPGSAHETIRRFNADVQVLPWLEDHRPFGEPLVPAAQLLHVFEGLRPPWPDVAIRNVRFLAPIAGGADGILTQSGDDPDRRFDLTLSIRTDEGGWSEAVRAEMVAVEEYRPAPLSPDLIIEQSPGHMTGAEFYDALGPARDAYGPAFRRIAGIWTGDGQALAKISGLEGSPETITPVIIDAAIQTVFAAGGTVMPGMPVHVGEVRFAGELGADEDFYALAVSKDPAEGGVIFDITLCALDGTPLAVISDLEIAPLKSHIHATDEMLLSVAWETLDLPGELTPGQRIFVTGEPSIAAPYLNAGDKTISDPDDLAELVGSGPVHIVSLQALEAARFDGEDALGDLDAMFDPLLKTVQTLSPKDEARLTIISRNACSVQPQDSSDPMQRAVWGFARSAVLEIPSLALSVIDVADPASAEEAETVKDLLGRAPGYSQLAVRGNEIFAAKLAKARPVERGQTDPAEERAFRLALSKPGEIDRLALIECDVPEIGPGDVLIETKAAALNFMDVARSLGLVSFGEGDGESLGFGMECAGTISAVGTDVSGLNPGMTIVAVTPTPRAMARFVAVPAELVFPVEDTVDNLAALSAQAIAFMTARYGLFELGRMKAGDKVLIHSGAGGVGLAAISLCKMMGVEIHATAGSEDKREYLRELGVASVHNSRDTSFFDGVMEATDGRGVDLVLNALAGEAARKSLELLAPFGRFIELGKRDQQSGAKLSADLFARNISYFAVDLSAYFSQKPDDAGELLRQVYEDIIGGNCIPVPVKTYPAVEAATAFQDLARSRNIGKNALTFDDTAALPLRRSGHVTFEADDLLLITGGTGGLGRVFAEWAAEKGAKKIALLSRNAPRPDVVDWIEVLRNSGADVRAYQGDVTDASSVKATVCAIEQDLGTVTALIHGAAGIDDGLIADLDRSRFMLPFATKAAGTLALLSELDQDALSFIGLHSSTASLLGAPGQSNYAAANAFMDGLAERLSAQGLPVHAINWGPWANVGGVADLDLEKRFAGRGQALVNAAEGCAAFEKVIGSGLAVTGAVQLDVARWAELYGDAVKPFLANMPVSGAAASASSSILDELRRSENAGRPAVLIVFIRDTIAKVSGLDPEAIDTEETTFAALGLDSLMSLELRNRLESGLGLKLSAAMIWNYPTFGGLAAYLLERLGFDAGPSGEPEAEESQAGGLSEAEVQNMSEEDAEAELLRRLASLGD